MTDQPANLPHRHRSYKGMLFAGVFYVLLVAFLVFYLRSLDWAQIRNAHFIWGYVLIASLFGLITRYWQVFIWFVLLKGLGAQGLGHSRWQLIYVYAKSWMGRYIPGTAPWILGKIYFASKHGIPKNKLAVSSLLEGALQVTVVMALAFLMLLFDRRLNVVKIDTKLLMAAVLAGCIIAILPPVFNRLMAFAYRLIKHQPLGAENVASSTTILKGVGLYAVGGLLNGLSLFFIAKGVYPSLSYHDLLFVMGVGNLASAASMLAIFAPSGLGVREGIQLVLLSIIMPKEFALLVTVITRLWGVAMDFVFFGLSKWLTKTGNTPSPLPDAPIE
jgi:uncharacterized membrane protein YbhN (UPF0104 family)